MPPTILVVDDTDAVRELCADVLSTGGYRVVSAGSAQEALHALDQSGEPIDAVLSDITMPQQSGSDFARMLMTKFPQVPVLLMSGSEPETPPAGPFLSKPFSPATLLRRMKELLDQSRTVGTRAETAD